jgi:hypothetical protein
VARPVREQGDVAVRPDSAPHTTPVTAEWALWGKGLGDTEYQLLECSDGPVGAGAFTEAITRYSPGNLDLLPQVTVNWLPWQGQHYVGMGIHDTGHGRYDPGGRKIVFTRYFCVPYDELRAGAVSYQSMYDAFDVFRLDDGQRAPIQAALPTFARPPEFVNPLATWAAGLLLTGRQACVLQADWTSLDERLRFLDSVMASLPYGMRSEMSAATWASATAVEHKLRLFFAGARRAGDDLVVTWGQSVAGKIRHRLADDYLHFLAEGGPGVQTQLAAMGEPVGFKARDIEMMVAALGSTPPTDVVERFEDPAAAEREMTVEEILYSLDRRLIVGGKILLGEDLNRLQAVLDRPTLAEYRLDYQLILKMTGLLRADRPVPKDTQSRFYGLLLRLAFDPRLPYADFRALEDCADGELHRPLLSALDLLRIEDLRARLLAMHALGDRGLMRNLWESSSAMIEAVASEELTPDHARVLCELVIGYLADRSKELGPEKIRPPLDRHGYLAGVLHGLYPGAPEHQRERLMLLLRLAHGETLNRRAVQEVLDSQGHLPTVALFAAVLSMTDRGNAEVAEIAYTRGSLRNANFAVRTREGLLAVLPYPADPRAALVPVATAEPQPQHARPRTLRQQLTNAIQKLDLTYLVFLVGLSILVFLVFYEIHNRLSALLKHERRAGQLDAARHSERPMTFALSCRLPL